MMQHPDYFKLNKKASDSKGKPPVIRNKYQYLTWSFIENARYFSGNDWKKEIAVRKRLFKTYPDFNFWKSLQLDFNLNSLCWFETTRGKKFLEEKNYLFKSTHVNFVKPIVEYEKEKLGEDKKTSPKEIKNLLDLFKNEKEKRK